MPLTELKITMTIRAPFLTKSSAPMDFGLDAVLAMDNKQRFYIPGTLIIGKLREAWQELASLSVDNFKPEMADWLGEKSDPNQSDDVPEETVLPQRKRLYIEDLVLTETLNEKQEKRQNSPNFRIRMDAERGVVEHGAYIATERPFIAGEEVTFEGIARFLFKNEKDTKKLITHLKIGLQWLTQLGANRTIGFGEVIKVEVKQVELEKVKIKPITTNLSQYDLRIIPQTPFCVAERRIAGNLFQSSEVIPGNVLKGTIANMWITLMGAKENLVTESLDASRPHLCRHFDKLRFTHAFPGKQENRPVKSPLSLVKVGKQVYDVALCEGPVLIKNAAPEFAVDWKDNSDVQKMFGWPKIKQELRVRTAIEGEKRRALENQLFAYEMIVPENGIAWYASLDLADVQEKERLKVVEELQSLLAQGVTGLGKTKAYTHINLLAEPAIAKAHQSRLELEEGVWIITLQTPALLCDPNELTAQEKQSQNRQKSKPSFLQRLTKKTPPSEKPDAAIVNQAAKLNQAYAKVWQQLSDGKLQLERFFATQSLTGGYYLWKRFQKNMPYQPYLLTDAGSVFVLKHTGDIDDAQAVIDKWLKCGLSLPSWAIKRYQLGEEKQEYQYWTLCPYIRHNGYGEIAVNLEIPYKKPKAGEFELIHKQEEQA